MSDDNLRKRRQILIKLELRAQKVQFVNAEVMAVKQWLVFKGIKSCTFWFSQKSHLAVFFTSSPAGPR